MAIANPPSVKDPSQAFQELRDRARRPPTPQDPNEPGAAKLVPDAIVVSFWPEADGTWTAHSPMLGVTATAETEAGLFGEMADQVAEFWDILNERFETASEELRDLLQLRYLGLRFERKPD